ncbi:MAG: tol-pal system protein YbgF [Alphaproteobacteria bacterium PA2]|nr:MAG: tol-pal system protein YbgF [Alphaproteobacteria bacterium PA2]
MAWLRTASALALSLTLVASGQAGAQTPIDPLDARDAKRLDRMEQVVRELRAIVFQGRDSGKPVVVQPAETDYLLQELSRRLSDMEQTLTRLNGQMETATFNLTQARKDLDAQKATNRLLAERVQTLEQAAAAAAATPVPAPASVSPTEAFNQARQLALGGDYASAEPALQDFITRYGDGPKGPEARYWLGKAYAARAANPEAATAFIGAIREWPQTSWAPDAVVELSRALVRMRKPSDACQTLDEFARRYPKAAPAVQSRATATRVLAKCPA